MNKAQVGLLTLAAVTLAVAIYSSSKSSRLNKHFRFKQSMQRKNWMFIGKLFWIATAIFIVLFLATLLSY